MLNSRLDALTDFPFQRLRELLEGVAPPPELEPLSLSIGEPQHTPPALIADTLAANAHLWGKYPPVEGTPDLRQAIAEWLTRRYGLAAGAVDPDRHVLPVAGTREALFLAGLLTVAPEKGGGRPVVLVPNPLYHVYIGAAVLSGAEPLLMDTGPHNGYLPDLEAIPQDVMDRVAMIFLCTPSNPQGAVADLNYLTRAVELARRHDAVLICDECYAEIYDRAPPAGALQACASLGESFDNVMVFHSLSKRSSAAGLRSGFVAGDAALMRDFRRLRSYGGPTIPMPVMAASAALWREESHVTANRDLYRRKFDLAEQRLAGKFDFYRPRGGFFLWLNVDDGEAAARKLWAEAAVRVLPGAYVSRADEAGNNPGTPFIRVALVGDPDSTSEALGRIVNTL